MVLGLVRDRAALAMTFVLPALFFLVFAAIFAGATGEQLRLKVAIADQVRDGISTRLLAALERDPALLRIGGPDLDAPDVRRLVRKGTADVGLIVRTDAEPLDSLGGFGPAPLLIVADPVRGVTVPMLKGQIQKAYFSALPDVALGSVVGLVEDQFVEFDEDQRAAIGDGLNELRQEADDAGAADWGFEGLFQREDVAGRSAAENHVAYYAGAVAILFLLFSSVHGAISMIDERDSGILDRVLAGPGRMSAIVTGKALFLVLQGWVQVAVIFVIAWAVHGVDLPGHLWPWAVTTVAASMAAAGMAMVIATAFTTKRQAQTFANVAILILSALGGSMVPRFFMPELLQDLGWLTPNTWALEAYTAIFWRDEPGSALVLPWVILVVAGLVGLRVAHGLARRLEIS
jgi:ABC-2 type transport system permease protein